MSGRPNIVFVVPDEFRPNAMGFLDKDPVITPNLNEFSKESLYLPNAVSSFPVCSPYRGMLFTGQYPYSNGVLTNCHTASSQYGVYLKPLQTCLPDIFSQCGYDCGYVGKWHLDAPEPSDLPYIAGPRSDGRI